jgi:prefoldin subunit 5
MIKPKYYYIITPLFVLLPFLTGCNTVTVYESPVTKFQTSVVVANEGIKTYLLGVNDVIARGNLYTVYHEKTNWVTGDFQAGIPDNELQLRLKALNTIANYANALATVVQSQDVANFQQAAKILGTNVDSLAATIGTLNPHAKYSLDLKDPVTSLATLVGTEVIQQKQTSAAKRAIIDGSTNVDAIIDKLKSDLPVIAIVVSTFEMQIWNGKLLEYDKVLKTASPEDVDSLIQRSLADYDSIKALENAPLLEVLDAMEDAHRALVVFARSPKRPKDLSDLASQIEVFSAQVQLFANALAAVQKSINSTK